MNLKALYELDMDAIERQIPTKRVLLELFEEMAAAERDSYLGTDTKTSAVEKLQTFRSQMQEHFSNYEFFKLTLAFVPEDRFLNTLKEKIFEKCGQYPIFEITIDPTIVGGALAEYRGFYFDLSMRSKLDAYLIANKHVLLSKL